MPGGRGSWPSMFTPPVHIIAGLGFFSVQHLNQMCFCRYGAILCRGAALATKKQAATPATSSNSSADAPEAAHILLAANVLLQWLAAHPGYASHDPSHATSEEVTVRRQFWTAAVEVMRELQVSTVAEGLAAAAETAEGGSRKGPPRQLLTRGAGGAPAAAGGGKGAGVGGGTGAVARSGSGGDLEEGGCLPEELELLGFEPLRSKHHWQVNRVGLGPRTN
jgi:hypothetical protein